MSIRSLQSCRRLSTGCQWMESVLWILGCLIPVVASLTSKSSSSSTYIVHTAPSEMPAVFQSPKSWYMSILASVSNLQSGDFEQRDLIYSYEVVSHGFAARLTREQIASLEKVPGFLSVVPDSLLQLQTTYTPEFMGLDRTAGLWADSNYGEDVIVGVIDTGVWPESQSFNDEGLGPVPSKWKGKCVAADDFDPSKSCNKKLIGARSFFSSFESVPATFDTEEHSNSPRDVEGHGTHTASTIAGASVANASFFGYAAGTARGISPRARIAVYKACWANIGGCLTSDVLKAIDQAVADGVDVISLSLGGPPGPFYEDPVAVGTFGAVEKGVVVSCAAGNAGPTPGSVINVAPWYLTVAASTVDRDFPATVKLGNGATYVGGSLYSGKGLGGKQVALIYSGDAGGSCEEGELDEERVRGKIVLCEKAEGEAMAVKLAGGAGVIVIQREDYGVDVVATGFVLPGAMVSFGDGRAIARYARGKVARRGGAMSTAALFFNGTAFGRRRAPAVMGFSSRGPNPVAPDILKPDVAAPGLNVLAAWSPAATETTLGKITAFNIISGTSMSCPHASGLAALLRAAHPDWSSAAIKSALMTSALTSDRRNQPILDSITSSPATPFHFGSGQVNPQAALHPGLIYDLSIQDYVNYLCGLKYTKKQLLLFTKGHYTCTAASNQLNYPSLSIVFHTSPNHSPRATRGLPLSATVTRTVTNAGAANAIYTAQFTQPADTSVQVVPATLAFHEIGEKLSFDVIITSNRRSNSKKEANAFGSLAWIDRAGGGVVRSPMVVTWRSF